MKGKLKERKWVITYEQLTPMGMSGSQVYKVEVWAKTKRGAEGYYNREIRRGYDSAYATTLYSIEPVEE